MVYGNVRLKSLPRSWMFEALIDALKYVQLKGSCCQAYSVCVLVHGESYRTCREIAAPVVGGFPFASGALLGLAWIKVKLGHGVCGDSTPRESISPSKHT
jgi:hypothetical protein